MVLQGQPCGRVGRRRIFVTHGPLSRSRLSGPCVVKPPAGHTRICLSTRRTSSTRRPWRSSRRSAWRTGRRQPRGRLDASVEGGRMGLTWTEPGEVAWALIDAHPDTDPLDLNFVDLHRLIVALPDFADDGTLRECGCTARVAELLAELDDGRMNILVEGGRRFRLLELSAPDDPEAMYLSGLIDYYEDEEPEAPAELRAGVLEVFRKMLVLMDVESPKEP